MTVWEMVAVAAAGLAAGAFNAVVGSGTLVTFPVLLAVGLPPVTATVSNSIGLVTGSVAGIGAVQGFLHLPPSPLPTFTAWLADNRAHTSSRQHAGG